MRKKKLRSGVGDTVVATRVTEDRREPEAVRLTTALHGARPRQWFRIIARLSDGGTALVAVGDSLAEVLDVARENASELPDGTVALFVEEWRGGLLRGFWSRHRVGRDQLPAVPGARKRGRKASLASAQ